MISYLLYKIAFTYYIRKLSLYYKMKNINKIDYKHIIYLKCMYIA